MDRKGLSRSTIIADVVLLLISLFWGTSFAIIKEALPATTPANFLFIRFSISCLILLPIAWARRASWSKAFIKPGVGVGLFLLGAFLTQAFGLVYTSASRSGLITGLSVILVPGLSILLLRQMPGRSPLAGAFLAFAGLYFLASVDSAQGLAFNIGDVLTFVCAILWAGHILALGYFSPRCDTFWLTFLQLSVSGIGSLGWAGLAGELRIHLPIQVWAAASYLAVFCTIIAYWGQTWAQTQTTPTRTAIILTMEPVFSALFAGWWLQEKLGLWGWMGAGCIVGGILLAELRPKK
jgi:drug/metabolite transporter (DMT)-like permease